MRHLILIVLLFSCKQIYNDPEISEKNNKSIGADGKLINGEVVSHFENGKVSGIHHFRDGIPDGKWRVYDHQGSLVQNGFIVEDLEIKRLLEVKYDIDYVLKDSWKEGNLDIGSIYVVLKTRVSQIPDSVGNKIIDRLKESDREVLFLYGEDTINIFHKGIN
ncbi:hypothetical protein [Chitinophaga sp. LS1]|uniref:hypothetical protein n=1 Tax=Chitinophaga sp. LS1 TaxID=3051176 RepID=UPI002AAAD23F|nr:hypothetical protein [Chitinophaga sp. LS1]WPV63908.1 hypothetical protein QQL36_19095 [Chitinophaga sp. LS1]